jgi:hypothetical protein
MSSFAKNFALIVSFLLVLPSWALAGYANYNNVLVGERAAGMGGAFTALSGDPAASPFYNPANTILQDGSVFSGSASVYNKYETAIGGSGDFLGSPAKINRGFFRAVPASSGTILNFKKFAAGISIVSPDYQYYNGEVHGESNTRSNLNFIDQSLWVGGTFSTRLSPDDSVGFTLYYTARTYQRSVDDRILGSGTSTITTEEKTLTSNSLVAVFGYHRQLNPLWSVGVSYRPPSVQIAGDGTYYKSTTVAAPYSTTEIYHGSTKAVTRIPEKISFGIALDLPDVRAISFDISLYGALAYQDFPEAPDGSDDLHHRQVANFALGYEQFIFPRFSVRTGLFTNLTSAESPTGANGMRELDQMNLYGWSANLCFHPREQTTLTFGGYYEGGSGLSTQLVSNSIKVLPKSQQIFTMLVGTGFHF